MISNFDSDDDQLPGLSHLEATPEILRGLLSGITEQQMYWKPAADRWSIAEILEHLSHAEGHCFRARAEKMAKWDNPVLEEYDQEALSAQGQYSGRDAEDSFDHFEEQREDNLSFLSSLPARTAGKTGAHPKLGTITLGQLMNEWAFHDLGHIRQIAEIARAAVYYPNMGPFAQFYKVNP
jgi:DinB superfamily